MASGLHKQRIWVQVSLEGIKIIDMDSNVSLFIDEILDRLAKSINTYSSKVHIFAYFSDLWWVEVKYYRQNYPAWVFFIFFEKNLKYFNLDFDKYREINKNITSYSFRSKSKISKKSQTSFLRLRYPAAKSKIVTYYYYYLEHIFPQS